MDTSKIIKGVVSSGRYTVTAPIVKEDYGLYLQIEGVELPETYQVDFSNSENSGTSVTMIGNADGVLIPRQFIDTGKDVFAFLYHVGADYGRTVYKFRIPNKVRPDRTNEEPTPEEQSVIDQAINALNEAVAQTAQDKADADVSAQNASADAERAEEARTDAQNFATQAEQSAQNAYTYALSADASSGTASDFAEVAQGYASQAQGYAQTASAKADSITRLTATATTLPDGSSATASYDAQTGVMSFGIPKGKDGTNGTDGDDGYSPSVTVTDIAGGHRVVITDKDGTKSFDVEDGATGATPNLTIGTVETLEPTETATASITGTPENPVLNLGIPQGEQGEVTLEEFYKTFPTDTANGRIASFVDGADDIPLKSLVVDINSVQDLHGYDSPWVGGGGKNILAPMFYDGIGYNVAVGTVLNLTEATDVFASGDTYTRTVGNWGGFGMRSPLLTTGTYYLMAVLASPNMRSSIYVLNSDMSVSRNLGNQGSGTSRSIGMVITLSGDEAYIAFNCLTSSAGNVSISTPMVALSSTATSFAPYENICPISGWTGMTVKADGKNLFYPPQIEARTNRGITVSVSGDTYTVTGTSTGIETRNLINNSRANYYTTLRLTSDVWVEAGTYTFTAFKSSNNNNNVGMVYGTDLDETYTSANNHYTGLNSPVTLTFSERTYITPYVSFIANVESNYTLTIQIESGSVSTPYEFYKGRAIPISWQTEAGTVYGGSLDVLTGKLTVYPEYDSYNGETLTGEWISDRDVYAVGTTPTIGAQVVNIGAEGTEYQLEPHEIASLLGQNNIFADTGDVSVEYRADTKLYISRLTEPDADMIADSNIVSGQYFMVGNSLYKATSNIANGGQIIVGTNCTRVSLAQALNEINA